MQLGFIGAGNIGTPMCRHLIEAGHTVLVYDVNAGLPTEDLCGGFCARVHDRSGP
jgi:3-hydroxyisobutyrate dehydrogenase-like beta-hydroxyacid dehydrogenase